MLYNLSLGDLKAADIDTNKVTIITADGTVTEGTLKSKAAVAKDIADRMEGLMGE